MSIKCKKVLNSNKDRGFVKVRYGIIILILIFFISIAFFLLLYTDLFIIEEIEVIGNNYFQDNEIIKASSLEEGMNIFKFNIGEIEDKIKLNSFIKRADITRQYPNKISIAILEREIACVVPYLDGKFIYIDEEGVVMKESNNLKSHKTPLITGLEDISFILGHPIEINPNWFKTSILNIINLLKNNDLLEEISEIHLLGDYNIQFYTNGGSVIKIGNDKILEEKIKFVKTFISQHKSKIIVDISHGGAPVYKPRINQEE